MNHSDSCIAKMTPFIRTYPLALSIYVSGLLFIDFRMAIDRYKPGRLSLSFRLASKNVIHVHNYTQSTVNMFDLFTSTRRKLYILGLRSG